MESETDRKEHPSIRYGGGAGEGGGYERSEWRESGLGTQPSLGERLPSQRESLNTPFTL